MIVVGLGPGDWDRVPAAVADLLLDSTNQVVVRTLHHPAATTLAEMREVDSCDDLYQGAETFDDVYRAIAERVVSFPEPVIYAVPGSPMLGEFAVGRLRTLAAEQGRTIEFIPGESFLDALWAALDIDPFRDGFQLLNGHDMPQPLVIDKPTVVGHLDSSLVLGDVCDRVGRVLDSTVEVVLAVDLGTAEERLIAGSIDEVDHALAGFRTSLFIPAAPGGLVGVVHAMTRLREECPWDRQQTHESLVRYLLEESHELIDAIASLGHDESRWGAYAEVEEELGDVLLQVLFHSAIAQQENAFDIDDVAEQLRQKLIRRHPHVFGDVDAADAETVKRNWDSIKADEGKRPTGSALDGVPRSLPGLARAEQVQKAVAAVGFDWPDVAPVFEKVREETRELEAEIGDTERAYDELGDLLFSVVNLARHLGLDAELALTAAVHRFDERFRAVENMGPIEGLGLAELDLRWEQVKRDRNEKQENGQ